MNLEYPHPPCHVQRQQPTIHDIRECAYRLYAHGGCLPGHDLENWAAAERLLEAQSAAAHYPHQKEVKLW
jgi:hypothetical protein